MTPKLYDSEDADFIQQDNSNTKFFEELLPRYDARYKQSLKEHLMDDCTSIKQIYEKLTKKFCRAERDSSHTISFHATSHTSQPASFFDLKLSMPIFTYIPTPFRLFPTLVSNKPLLNVGERPPVFHAGLMENMPCYVLDFNRVSLSKKGFKGSSPPNIGSGIYTKHTHKGKFVIFSSPNFLKLGGSISSTTIDDYSKELIDKCFEYAYWNLPAPKKEKSSRLDNLIFHGGRDIFYDNVFKFNKTLIRIISIKQNRRIPITLLKKSLKCYQAKVSVLVDDGNKIFSELRDVLLTETIAESFTKDDVFAGLILSQDNKILPAIVFGSLGNKLEPDDLTSLVSLVMHKELQDLNQTSSITFVDTLNNLLTTISELIKNNSNYIGVFNPSFKSISDREDSLKNSIENLFPLYINDGGDIHQLSTTVISFLLSHNTGKYNQEILKNKKAILLFIKILDSAIVNSNDWTDETQLQLKKLNKKGSDSLTAPIPLLFAESLPKLVHLMVCSRVFSQKF
jgi:hypothetical protein